LFTFRYEPRKQIIVADFKCLIAAIGRLEAMIQNNQEKVGAKIDASQEKMEAKIETNNEKCEALRGTLLSWMDIYQARTEAIEEKIIAKMDAH
jgi:hypothetical protein